MNKTDLKILAIGLRRVAIALLTTITFAAAIIGFVTAAFLKGYLAVLLFVASILILIVAYGLLYAQGIGPHTYTESKGEKDA